MSSPSSASPPPAPVRSARDVGRGEEMHAFGDRAGAHVDVEDGVSAPTLTPSSSSASRRIAVSGSSSSSRPAAVSMQHAVGMAVHIDREAELAGQQDRGAARRRRAGSWRHCRGRRSRAALSSTRRRGAGSRTSSGAARTSRRRAARRRATRTRGLRSDPADQVQSDTAAVIGDMDSWSGHVTDANRRSSLQAAAGVGVGVAGSTPRIAQLLRYFRSINGRSQSTGFGKVERNSPPRQWSCRTPRRPSATEVPGGGLLRDVGQQPVALVVGHELGEQREEDGSSWSRWAEDGR